MKLPGYTAESSLSFLTSRYPQRTPKLRVNGVVPALPSAQTCDWAADQCDANPKSPACRVLQHCTGPIARNQASGGPSSTGAFGNFTDYLICAAECGEDKNCIDMLC